MRRPRRFLVALCALSLATAWAATGREEARGAARGFGEALVKGQPAGLRALLPDRGKVFLALDRLAPEKGYFAAGQVEAVFRDALAQVAVHSFEVERLESDGETFALVHGRVSLTDREGRAGRVSLHLSFQPENDAWVIREIKESPE